MANEFDFYRQLQKMYQRSYRPRLFILFGVIVVLGFLIVYSFWIHEPYRIVVRSAAVGFFATAFISFIRLTKFVSMAGNPVFQILRSRKLERFAAFNTDKEKNVKIWDRSGKEYITPTQNYSDQLLVLQFLQNQFS